MPWRKTYDPYEILVSEIMLQQTQVSRVLTKYTEFLKKFPTVHVLAGAPVAEVLRLWQGLGYNRRALNLQRAAQKVVADFGGTFPKTSEELESLPGVGQSTRGAILAFACGIPTVFIETNIRTIYIHHFFSKKRRAGKARAPIHDRDLLPLIEKTLDQKNPRDWYYALMDYGVYLKQTLPNPSRKSAHHTTQSTFKGSNRELRSHILKEILKAPQTVESLYARLHKPIIAIDTNLRALEKEGFIQSTSGTYKIK